MKTVVAGALGECVHVAGVSKFLRLAEQAGWKTVFLGPAVPPRKMLDAVRQAQAGANGDPVLVGVSYRLTPETGERLLGQFAEEASELHESGVRFVFGGTPPVARARRSDRFLRAFLRRHGTGRRGAGLSQGPDPGVDRGRNSADHRRAHPLEGALSAPAPPFRPAHHGSHPRGDPADCGSQSAGRDLAGHRPGCAGQLLPPRAPRPAPDGRGRRAGAQPRRLPRAVPGQPDAEISRCCEPTPARTILSSWPKCTWRPSTSPGARSRCSGSTGWTGAAPGIWKARSASTRR